jgi:hypothetical protein
MDDNINFRSFKEGDYETCCEWWKWWWKRTGLNPVQRALLPDDDKCFIIEKNGVPIAAYFLLVFEFRVVAFTTYLVTNPKYREKDRRELIKQLVLSVENEAEKLGVMQLFTICMNDHMTNIHDSLDWMLIPVQNEGFKYLTNNFIKQK